MMKKTIFLAALCMSACLAKAQNYTLNGEERTSQIVALTVDNFNGQTLASSNVDKRKTITLAKTSFYKQVTDYNILALPELRLGNIIGHPTLGWDDKDYYIPENVPEFYSGDWTLNDVFYDGDYPVAIYGRAPKSELFAWGQSEQDISRRGRDPHLIMLVDPDADVRKVYNTSKLTFPPKNRAAEIDRQSVHWAVVKDGILYFSIFGLDGFDGGQNNYIVAIDTRTDQTLWVSKPYTCSSQNFLIIGSSIVCGYGGTGIPDFVNVLNRFTGVQKQHIKVATAPEWFALGNDGNLYVLLYDRHISFTVNY